MSEARRSTDRKRAPDEIERELEAERAKLHETVERLSQRFSGEYAWELAGRYLREKRGSFESSAGRVLREKPFAVMLTAIGISWMLFGPKNPAAAQLEGTSKRGQDISDSLVDRSYASEPEYPVPAPRPETRPTPVAAGYEAAAGSPSKDRAATPGQAPTALAETTPYTRPSDDGLASTLSRMDAVGKRTSDTASMEDRKLLM